MPSISSDARFLGVDIALLWRDMREPWRNVHQWPVLAWLTPQPPVLLLQADGTQSVWGGGHQVTARATPRFRAIELPDELVLRRPIQLPVMAADDARAAMALEARSNSPFDAADMVWGYSLLQSKGAHAAQRGELVLASRKQVAQHLAAVQAGSLGQSVDWSGAEVWVLTAHGQPAVLPGYGEAAREAHGASRRRWGFILLAALALGAAALAVTPTIQLRSRALEAAQAHEALVKSAAPVVHQREQLLASVDALGALSELTNGRIEPLRVLDKLTQVLPDDTALHSIKLHGSKLAFVGHTGNASALMQLLSDVHGFKDVRAPTATTRLGNMGKEVFAVELTLDPEVFGVQSTKLASPVSVASEPTSAAPAVVSSPAVSPGGSASAPSSAASAALLSSGASSPVTPASDAAAKSAEATIPAPLGARGGTPAPQARPTQADPAAAAPASGKSSFGGRNAAPAAPPKPSASAPVRQGASS